MTMGQRIRLARQEAGLSQRELAGEEITRNMLSCLEHDTANPSVATLRYLSEKLGKPASYFLGEDVPQVAGWQTLESARAAYDGGQFRRCVELLAGEAPGQILAREWELLENLARLSLAEQAIGQGRLPYAREVLTGIRREGPYFTPELGRKADILAAKCPPTPGVLPQLVARISAEDDVLLLRAGAALAEGRPEDAARYLHAAEDRTAPQWNHLMGKAHFAREEYRDAARCFHLAEQEVDLRRELEICYRELEDFKMAYFYATKQR